MGEMEQRADSPSEATPIGLGVSKAIGAGTGQAGLGGAPSAGGRKLELPLSKLKALSPGNHHLHRTGKRAKSQLECLG